MSKWLCCGHSSGSKINVLPCVLNPRAPIVLVCVRRSTPVARFRERTGMIKPDDRDDFESEASKETVPVPLPVAGVSQSLSPLASLVTFLSTLMLHAQARIIHEIEACVTLSMKGRSSLVAGEDFQGMFLTVGIWILLGFAVGVLCCLFGRNCNVAELVEM